MIQNYENSLNYNNNKNGDSYSIHDTFNINKKDKEIDDLRKYKEYFQNKKTNKKFIFLVNLINICAILYLIYTLLKFFRLF